MPGISTVSVWPVFSLSRATSVLPVPKSIAILPIVLLLTWFVRAGADQGLAEDLLTHAITGDLDGDGDTVAHRPPAHALVGGHGEERLLTDLADRLQAGAVELLLQPL